MNNVNTNINIFEKLLLRFKFKLPLHNEAKKFIIRNEQDTLITTLKKFDDYNFVYGLVIKIFYISYKVRLRFSMKQSKIILAIVSTIIIIAVSISILFSAEFATNRNAALISNQLLPEYTAKVESSNTIINKANKNSENFHKEAIKDTESADESVKYILGINLFSAKNIELDLSPVVTDNISKELVRILGKNKVIDLRNNQNKVRYNKMLTGSISRLGEKLIISAKVVNVENSKLIFGTTETVEAVDELSNKCNAIVERLVKEIEKE